MRYESPEHPTRTQAEAAFASGTPEEVGKTVIGLALNDPDSAWVTAQALMLAEHPEAGVRNAAAVALGHLARLHGRLDSEQVVPTLRRLASAPETAGAAENALEDIEIFVR